MPKFPESKGFKMPMKKYGQGKSPFKNAFAQGMAMGEASSSVDASIDIGAGITSAGKKFDAALNKKKSKNTKCVDGFVKNEAGDCVAVEE